MGIFKNRFSFIKPILQTEDQEEFFNDLCAIEKDGIFTFETKEAIFRVHLDDFEGIFGLFCFTNFGVPLVLECKEVYFKKFPLSVPVVFKKKVKVLPTGRWIKREEEDIIASFSYTGSVGIDERFLGDDEVRTIEKGIKVLNVRHLILTTVYVET